MPADKDTAAWQPGASLQMLQRRAQLLTDIRQFFSERQFLEVETPVLAHSTSTEVHMHSFATYHGAQQLFLQTSPEFHMKRLLAAGCGPVYQVSRVFRRDERGRHHNPEFTMLEWYQPGFDHHQLMDQVQELLLSIGLDEAGFSKFRRVSYAELFAQYTGIDPHRDDIEVLRERATALGIQLEHADQLQDRDDWLNLILSHQVEPQLDAQEICFVYDYPASQASLARVRPGQPEVAERFEVYVGGIELANGFHELADAHEQRRRMQRDQQQRQQLGLDAHTPDPLLLAALEAGLPDCAGVALGLERVLMALTGAQTIDEVMAFSFTRA